MYINWAISEFYHPMAARGDLFHPLRKAAVSGPILAAIAMFSMWLWRRPLAPRTYLIGLSVLAVTALLPVLPRIDNGYREVYWLGEDRYEIPWQYDPYNGGKGGGGKSFSVKVSVPDLIPKYETQGETILIGKAIDFSYSKGGAAPEEICTKDAYQFKCEWRVDNFVYKASGRPDMVPSENSGLYVSAAKLLDSFRASEP